MRQHHTRAGWNICKNCHWDADPANYVPVDEDVAPSYYGSTADTLADNPLNDVAQANFNENWTIGDFVGLDNDGDQVYDAADQGNIAPVADHGGPYTSEVNIAVAFDGSLSYDPDGSIVSWEWNFGDGNTGSGPTPTHTYTAEDTYTVTLTVTDNGTATDVATTEAVIGLPSPAPPVNQTIGFVDRTGGTMEEADCRACHTAPSPPERHHNLFGTDIPVSTLLGTPPTTIDADGDNNDDTNYTCFNCHAQDGGGNVLVESNCVVCHTSNAHHGAGEATNGTCTTCHGDIVDDMDDLHYVPSDPPSLVTPSRSGGAGLPLNSYGDGAGACDYCHNDDGLATPIIKTNMDLHHGTGLDTDNCTWCHFSGDPAAGTAGEQMRTCEGCHGPDSLHNIQADSPNANNRGSLVVGGEDAGYGHVGRDAGPADSDCWGCHGFSFTVSMAEMAATAGAPGTDALVPTVYGCEPATMTAGTDTAVHIDGSGLTNTTGETEYESKALLTAADGSKVTLTPAFIDEKSMGVLIGGNTAPGNYTLRAVKTDSQGNPVASNPVSFSVLPELYITTAISPKTTVTLTGGGFSGYAKGSGTAVIGSRKVRGRLVKQEGTVVSWSETTIVASFDASPDSVTVHTVFGSVTSAVSKKPPRQK